MKCKYKRPDGNDCQFESLVYRNFQSETVCPFHLPISDKENWSVQQKRQFPQILQDAVHRLNGDLTGIQIPNWQTISGMTWNSRAVLDAAVIASPIKFQNQPGLLSLVGAQLADTLTLSNCRFTNGLILDDVAATGRVVLDNTSATPMSARNRAKFIDGLEFRNNCQLTDIDLENTVFGKGKGQNTSFSAAATVRVGGSKAVFVGASFWGNVDAPMKFEAAQIDFRRAEFRELASFAGAHFGVRNVESGETRFDQAIFHKGLTFQNAKFNHPAFLRNLDVREDLNISNTTFHKPCTISCLTKYKSVLADNATFSNLQFSGIVEASATFDEVVFEGPVKFEASFGGNVSFYNADFQGAANFEKNSFGGNSNFATSTHLGFQSISFSGAEFSGPVSFEHRTFLQETSFSETKFAVAPRFYYSNLHPSVIFGGISYFHDFNKDAIKRYQTLRHKCEEQRSRHEEGVFHALEQRARRKSGELPRTDWVFSSLYDLFALYGTSLFRPLLSLLILVLSGSTIIAFHDTGWRIDPNAGFDFEIIGESVLKSARNIFVPFYQFRQENGWSSVVHLLQSLLAVPLIAVFLLAVRWRFRRG